MSMSNFVLDKSYLFSETAQRIKSTAKELKFLICESLLLEVLKDSPKERSQLFSKLPEPPICWEYIPSVSKLIQFEQKNNSPCNKPSEHTVERDYSITEKLKDANYTLRENHSFKLEEDQEYYEKLLEYSLQEIQEVFVRLTIEEAKIEYQNLLNGKIKNIQFINDIILRSRSNGASVPQMENFDERWLTFRFFQVRYLHAVDLRRRYRCFDLLDSKNTKNKVLHDIHDMNYLMLALLEGGFATKESKLKDWWKAINGKSNLLE